MNCETFQAEVSRWMDGELPRDAAFRAHMESCAACARDVEAQKQLHRRLEATLGGDAEAMAERVAGRVRQLLPVTVREQASDGVRPRWKPWAVRLVTLAIGVAAGLLWAIGLRSPTATEKVLPQPFATVEMVTGPIQVNGDALSRAARGSRIHRGDAVRSGEAKCAWRGEDGLALRLDAGTEVRVREDGLHCVAGRMWCRVPPGEVLKVVAGDAMIQVGEATCDLQCGRERIEVLTLAGQVQVVVGGKTVPVIAGERVRIDLAGNVTGPHWLPNPSFDTRWVHELLACPGEHAPELRRRVQQLWESMGSSKVTRMYEDELRRLGAATAGPLLDYLQETSAAKRQTRRRHAAQLAADLASRAHVGQLIEAIPDDDPEVRVLLVTALGRLSGRSVGPPPEAYRQASPSDWQAGQAQWLAWWNRQR